jgi:hypothetical protein
MPQPVEPMSEAAALIDAMTERTNRNCPSLPLSDRQWQQLDAIRDEIDKAGDLGAVRAACRRYGAAVNDFCFAAEFHIWADATSHFTRIDGVQHRDPSCKSKRRWQHVWGDFACLDCLPPTEDAAVISRDSNVLHS